jgi:hypothetical protein
MSCVLQISGKNLDLDSFLAKSRLKPYKKGYKGDTQFRNKPDGKKLSESYITFLASNADFEDLSSQIRDTIKFLKKNRKGLSYVSKVKGIDSAFLHFGIDLRIDKENILVQTDIFPSELLKVAGDLKIDIAFSIYPPDLEVS